MATSEAGERPTRARRNGRGTGPSAATTSRDDDLDLLTAALIGLAAGVGVTLLLRRGPSGSRPLMSGMGAAGRGARLASLAGMEGMGGAAKAARRVAMRDTRGARHGIARGMKWAEELPLEEMGSHVRDYFEAAKEAIDDTVSGELQDLKKSIRRKRRQFGI
ncbi:MAG: hypothetical protein ACR2MQ_04360 [Gemmatimonadaceae bacterium]